MLFSHTEYYLFTQKWHGNVTVLYSQEKKTEKSSFSHQKSLQWTKEKEKNFPWQKGEELVHSKLMSYTKTFLVKFYPGPCLLNFLSFIFC